MSKQLILIIFSLFVVQLSTYYWSHTTYVASQTPQNLLLSEFKKQFNNPSTVLSLDLNGKGLTKIPDDFQVFTNLQTIDLSNNKLTKIPKWLLERELDQLNLSHNQLTQIPNFENSTIRNLNLRHNQISFSSTAESSDKIYMPKGLKVLNLSDNSIQYLPSTLYLSEQSLKEINISNNPIDAVDISLLSLEKIICINSGKFNDEFVKNTKHIAPNYEDGVNFNYTYNYSHTD